MTATQKIMMALAYRNMSQRDLAKNLGETPQNLYLKLKRDTFKIRDLDAIAKAMGGKLVLYFDFGGVKI